MNPVLSPARGRGVSRTAARQGLEQAERCCVGQAAQRWVHRALCESSREMEPEQNKYPGGS